jgi:uncharacterized pyridoxamine 5'-phosphate oxidase family protein
MKTVKKLLVMAVLASTFLGYANNYVSNSENIYHDNPKVLVSVKDDSGNIVYLSPVKQKGDLKTLFDYSLLENGLYTLEIENNYLVEIQSFKVFDNSIEFVENSKKTIYKPVFKKEDAKILISKVGLDINTMKVEIYYENELIHSETVSSENPILKRVYQLDIREKGNYYAVMTSNGRVYKEKFKL